MSKWHYSGPHEGLYYGIHSSGGIHVNAATKDSAEAIVRVLNDLEERAVYASQLYQDHCENAFVEATIHKQLVRAATAAVIAFGSETEGDAIHLLGQVLAGNVYSIIPANDMRGRFFVDAGDRIEYCETREQAIDLAQCSIDECRDCCDPEWPDEVERICYGVVLGAAKAREVEIDGRSFVDYEIEEQTE